MANSKARKIVLVCCAAAVISMTCPATSQGCEFLDRLMPWNWCRSNTPAATYAPAYSVQYPYAAQTCNYVPQTSYRTVMRTVPTTVYRPTSYCDPCTGCATTCYRPVTSYVRSAQLVPYTTYRPVWTNSCYTPCATPCATTCATTCGTACGSSNVITTYASPANGCSSCAPAPATTLVPTPMQGTTTQPSNDTTTPVIRQNTPAQQYQQPNGTLQYRQNKPIKPVPEKDVKDTSLGGPQLNGPAIDRTTARSVRQATYQAVYRPAYQAPVYQPVVNRAATNTSTFDYGGWKASNK